MTETAAPARAGAALPSDTRSGEGRLPVEWRAVSPWAAEGLADSPAFARAPLIADCTLRDGEQQPGVVFTVDQKIEIAAALARLGVHDLELGTPAVSAADAEAIQRIVDESLGVQTSALARAMEKDVDLVRSCGVDAVRLSMPISARQRAAKTGVSDADYVSRALSISSYAKGLGLEVVFSPYDTTRCEPALLEELLQAFAREGCVDRVRLVDTTGAATPEAIRFLVRLMDEAGGIPIEVHCHNDFGLATANTIAGVLAGARYASATVNGVGERSGNAALEEIVVALAVLYDIDTGVRLEGLTELSHLVEAHSSVQLQPHKAIVGRNSFAHESGLVVSGLLRDTFTAESYVPELVGQTRRIVVGKKSGRAAVEAKVEELYGDERPAELDVDSLVPEIKQLALRLGRSLEDDEIRQLILQQAKGRPNDV